MNILFYVEPLIEKDDPYWKVGWVTQWSNKLAEVINKFTEKSSTCIVLSEALNSICKLDLFDKSVVVTQKELTLDGQYNAEELLAFWYRNATPENVLKYYISMFREKIDKFIPDIVISFTPIPFIKSLYPNVKVLYFEYSFLSRLPFYETWFLDPIGVYDYSFLNKYIDQIKEHELTEDEILLLNKLKSICKDVFLNNNPFEKRLMEIRKDYYKIILLPLQFSRYYAFDCQVKFKSQYEYMMHVIEHLPQNVAIIITIHPQHSEINDNAKNFVRKKYNNVFIFDDIMDYDACSQYFLPLVDIVITVSSSTGLQTLLFDNKLITFGHAFDFISDGDFSQFIEVINKNNVNEKGKILFFLLTRYAITANYLFNPKWLEKYFNRVLNISKKAQFYKLIDVPEIIINNLCKILVSRKNELPYKSFIKLERERRAKEIEKKDIEIIRLSNEIEKMKATKAWKIFLFYKSILNFFCRFVYDMIKMK